jgi:lipid II:glycine glycyltransferase (peptidoglycan interpeptide bridge formation enzyme)
MHIRMSIITDKIAWEEFVLAWPNANFLQSWNWGVFHQKLGKTVMRLGWFDEQDRQVAGALIVKESAKRGPYMTVSGGPLLDWSNRDLAKRVTQDLKEVAQAQKAWFVRFRPQALNTPESLQLLRQLGAELAPMHLTADLTLQLDLTQPAETILTQMRKSTRYEVKRAEKLGIRVTMSTDTADIDRMYQDQLELATKHGFVPFSLSFWKDQFESFKTDNQVALFHAWLGDELLATAFIIFYHQEAVYHYGTSTPANAKQPGSYACQWAAIQEAQARGCRTYNFWGVAPADQPKHRFAGVTLFKTGFSEHLVEYLPAHDLVVSPLYYLVKAFELGRKKMRRL